jgi:hypothetical protein
MDDAIKEVEGFGSAVEVGFPDDGGKVGVLGHDFEKSGEMDSGFAADPLEVAGALGASPGNSPVEEFVCEFLAAGRVEGVEFSDAKHAAEIAAREIEEMGRDEFEFVAIFEAMLVEAGNGSGFARANLAGETVGVAAVFAKGALVVVGLCALQVIELGGEAGFDEIILAMDVGEVR